MKIQYLGHSCFRLISQLGTAIICDPYKASMVGFEMPKLSCDVVTVSHHHDDHCCLEEVAGDPPVLENEVYLAADDVAVQSIKCWHDDKQGKLRGDNFVFCFLIDGYKVVHMGDVGELNEDLVKRLYGCDFLLLPVGGIFTIDAAGAKWYVDKIRPRYVLPMHYKTSEHKFNLGSLEDFLKLFDEKQIRRIGCETIQFDEMLDDGQTEILVLDRYIDD